MVVGLVCTAADGHDHMSDRDQSGFWSHMIAEYFPRSDRDQMLIEASPTVLNGGFRDGVGWSLTTEITAFYTCSFISCVAIMGEDWNFKYDIGVDRNKS